MTRTRKVGVFWPGDYRDTPNQASVPQISKATEQMMSALKKLGRAPYLIEGFLTRPHESIEKLGPIDDPLVGIFVHWVYGPHTADGVSGKQSPLLLASNFAGTWPGLVGLLNTSACLELLHREHSRIWTEADDWTKDELFMERLDEWCCTGRIAYSKDGIRYSVPLSAHGVELGRKVAADIKKRRILAMMLGDTAMGMINGYFGPELLHRVGFTEHKVDQAWLVDRAKCVNSERIETALNFCLEKGVKFHWEKDEFGRDVRSFTRDSTRQQLAMYLCVLDLVKEFKADCVGWQYQLGLIPLLPPSDFCEGLLNSTCRPEGDGDSIVCSTEGDQGNMIPMELMKRLLKAKGLNQTVNFHDVRWGGMVGGRFAWVMLNSGSCSAYAFNHDPDSLRGVHSYCQDLNYFPFPGGTFTGESLPGEVTWARAYIKGGELWMDLGRGEVLALTSEQRKHFWGQTCEIWPLMMLDMHCSRDTLMAHYISNHVAVCYGDVFDEMFALSLELGFKVRVLNEG